MEAKSITEKWIRNRIERESNLEAKLSARDYWSKKQAKVDQRFAIKHYIDSLGSVKKFLAKWLMKNWFVKENREDSGVLDSEGYFCFPEANLDQ